jgi:3-(3-hydroxy-phenyl)propionate hydroxylase
LTPVQRPIWRQMARVPVPTASTRVPVLIVGAGPVGLTLAVELGRRGHRVIVLNRLDYIPGGSRAICFSRRTLEIWDRLGAAAPMVARGVTWSVGKVFWGDRPAPVYEFDLRRESDRKMPAFINLQQFHVEEALVCAVAEMPNVELRWGHELVELSHNSSGALATIETESGRYQIAADWLIACDGSRSRVRACLGLEMEGARFDDNFLIADIRMAVDRPAERWFWFDPPFNPGQSALLHQQPDGVWRLDFQLGANIDREAAVRPENVEPLVRGLVGAGTPFEPEWYSLYQFQCRRLQRFVHGRVVFAGDSAHIVSPFGARGCNGGILDADNLAWKLDRVLTGAASERLIESYNSEATAAAEENIRYSTASTEFISPKGPVLRQLRDSVLELAGAHAWARPFVNSGRLSTAPTYADSPLNTCDTDGWEGGPPPGGPPVDGRIPEGWLLERLGGDFALLLAEGGPALNAGIPTVNVADDVSPALWRDYDLSPGAAYLFRPDQNVAARWRAPSVQAITAAIATAKGGANERG